VDERAALSRTSRPNVEGSSTYRAGVFSADTGERNLTSNTFGCLTDTPSETIPSDRIVLATNAIPILIKCNSQ
jgi:hypothetical protein